jgi:UDP-N-acetylmuramyl pentapeptide phosphotransferase/UDP-N-acetylglucosamine-1-phosphate transferase
LISAIANAVIVAPLLALLASSATVALLVRSRFASLALDHPNQRSLHVVPTPRLGGLGILAGVGAAWGYAQLPIDPWLLGALVLLVAVSVLDDVKKVNVIWRLFVHFVSAALAVVALIPSQSVWMILLAILATAWMINLYNFMDGSDGLAGGMAVIGFGTYGIAALIADDFSFAAVNLSIAAAALGFLLFNFPPAKIFMGDAGAIALGFLAAILNLAGAQRGVWPAWMGIVVFSPFIADASATLCKRLLRRAKIWHAHREHYYQRLVKDGWGHRKTAAAEYALMLACGGSAIWSLQLQAVAQFMFLAGVAVGYVVLIYALERKLPRIA